MPCPPTLTAIIRWHIAEFGLGPGGRLFVGERNKEELPILTINRIWRQARLPEPGGVAGMQPEPGEVIWSTIMPPSVAAELLADPSGDG